jgi:ACS family probable galactarate transporter
LTSLARKVYTYGLFFWSLFTFLQGFVDMFPLAWAGISMFFMRFMLGFSGSAITPGGTRIVAAWFPTKERGTASTPSLTRRNISRWRSFAAAWLADFHTWGWEHVFTVMRGDWFVLTALWIKLIQPTDRPRMSAEGGLSLKMARW